MDIIMLDASYALEFVDANKNVCNYIEYQLDIANQIGTATENDYRDPLEPEDRWYDISLNNDEELKCIHSSWFKIIEDESGQ